MKKLSFVKAINEAVLEEMQRDETVFLIGEDVGEYGGVWLTFREAYERFGKARAMDTPISESGFVGLCVGAAMTGLRPITEIMYNDFFTTCMDPLCNQAAKIGVMSGFQFDCPITVLTPCGMGTREGAQHSQSLEAWFCHTPGLKVLFPSNPYDMKGLLKSAVRDNSPVIIFENRLLWGDTSMVDENEEILVPLGKANILEEGKDLTIVTYGYATKLCEKALQSDELSKYSVELIDLRSLVPLDLETIIHSVKKTGRLLIVHEAPVRGGYGSEIVRLVIENAFDYLDAEPIVYGGRNTPIPFNGSLEDACIIQEEEIKNKICQIIN